MDFNWRVWLRRAYWLLLVFVVVVSVLTLFSTVNIPGKSYPKWLVVYSGSMTPAIRTGSLVLVKQEQKYQAGDVISYITEKELGKRNPKYVVTHRIIEERQDSRGKVEFIAKGDANSATDSALVKSGLILGKVIFTLPLVGYVVGFTQTLPGLIILIIIPATVIVYSEVMNLKNFVVNRVRKGEKDETKKV